MQLQADPEFMRMRAEQEKNMAERKAQLSLAEKPILEDLARLGFDVTSVWLLKSKYREYKNAIPILLDHLRKPYPDIIRAGIAQVLAIRATRKIGWKILVEEYCKIGLDHAHVKDSIAAALSQSCDDSVIQELISLAKDKSNGSSRIMLLAGIKRSKRSEAKQAIDELADDPELAKEIKSWHRKCK
jgi:hypothetical protein